MLPKLKLKASANSPIDGPSSLAGSPIAPSPGGGIIKLKLNNSQPPTPAIEHAPDAYGASGGVTPKVKGAKGAGKKRQAGDDISPAPKRPTLKNKISLKIPSSTARISGDAITPISAGGVAKIKLARKKSTGPKLTGLFASKGRPIPKRKPGEGYDSEDSDVEEDPAIQQGLILRMQPSDDADYLRAAIAEGKIGLPKEEGGADVTIRFVTADFRRALVKVRTRTYGAVLVDLPCIVESMKSWDRKGWWKVSDISQMLLVLGPCQSEDEAKSLPLPREVERNTWQYAHGLTPPMHWVRKRRFRKRADHRTMANAEEEVERLLREDEEVERAGGTVEALDHDPLEREQSYDVDPSQYGGDDDEDAEGDAYSTVENEGVPYEDYTEMDTEQFLEDNLEDDLQAAFDANFDESTANVGGITESPISAVDRNTSFAGGDHSMGEAFTAETPIGTPGAQDQSEEDEDDEDESDDDDDDDEDDNEDSPDVVDEDAAARAAEKAQQLEEVADIEREIANVRVKIAGITNQLLRTRELSKLQSLERELSVKRDAFGLNAED